MRMRTSIKRKMWFAFAGFMAALIVVGIVFTLFFLKPFYISRSKVSMQKMSRELVEEYQEYPEGFGEYIDAMDKSWNTSITVINPKFRILYTSLHREGSKEKIAKKTRIAIRQNRELLDKSDYCFYSDYWDNREKQSRLMYIEKMPDENYMVLRQSVKGINTSIQFFIQFYLIAGFFLFCFGSVLISVLANQLSHPIVEMSRVAEEISQLNFNVRVVVKSKDEMGKLADAMNQISEQMDKNIKELMRDIERRKMLVRDLSHELKTPIGVLKGYAEGLKYMVTKNPQKMERYCDVIVAECDRMNDLVRQMLNYSKLEILDDSQVERIFMKDLAHYVRERYSLAMQEKQIQYYEETEPLLTLNSMEILIRQVVDNLISNALRYTPKQGEIRLSMFEKGDMAAIRVYNSGSSIPEEHMQDIFEVFYQLDDARSREKEGYGIGLAIVKQIARQHGGWTEVENTQDGVAFYVYLQRDLKKSMLSLDSQNPEK